MRRIYAVMVMLMFLWGTGAQAATVSFNPLNSAVSYGSTFTVDITGQSFPITQGGGVNLYYDNSIVNVLTVSIDSLVWDFVNSPGSVDNGTGSLTSLYVSAFPGVDTGTFTVASVEFQAVGTGTTSLTMTEFSGNPWASDGSLINPTFLAGSVTATVIPEPSSMLLLGSGLAAMLGLMRSRR